MDKNYLDLSELVLPQFLVHNFDLENNKQGKEVLNLYFVKRNFPPQEHASMLLVSKGFHREVTIQDLPLRSNTVYLHVKRRPTSEGNSIRQTKKV